jgi:hypothetical protein
LSSIFLWCHIDGYLISIIRQKEWFSNCFRRVFELFSNGFQWKMVFKCILFALPCISLITCQMESKWKEMVRIKMESKWKMNWFLFAKGCALTNGSLCTFVLTTCTRKCIYGDIHCWCKIFQCGHSITIACIEKSYQILE